MIAVAHDADDNQEENEKKNRSREELAEISQAVIEGRLFGSRREASYDIAKGRPSARLDDLRRCCSTHDGCAHERPYCAHRLWSRRALRSLPFRRASIRPLARLAGQ